jgi:DNA adenine methylase
MKSPIHWFGGKGRMTAKLLPLIPPHHTYVEPFGGGASLLFAKTPSPVEVYNDRDEALVNFFLVLADPRLFKLFLRRVILLPYSRALYKKCLKEWREQTDPVEQAWRWFVVNRQSMSGRFASGWGFDVSASSGQMSRTCSAWLSACYGLPQIHRRLQRVQIECNDWRKILDSYDRPDIFFYCDPPYPLSVRRSGGYAYELTEANHADLISCLLRLSGKVMISGYDHPEYRRLKQAGWRQKKFMITCSAAGRTRAPGLQGRGSVTRKQSRTEIAWMNYNLPEVNP